MLYNKDRDTLYLQVHFLHALPDVFNCDVEYSGDLLWCRRIDVSRLTFHTDAVLDVFFKSPCELENVDCVGVLTVRP